MEAGQCGVWWHCQRPRMMVIGKGEDSIYQVLCNKPFPGKTQPQSPSIPHRDPITDQSTDATQVKFDEPSIGLWVRGCLEEQKGLQDSCITKAGPSKGDSSQKTVVICSLQMWVTPKKMLKSNMSKV